MSAEVLREAATLMRERADMARAGRWSTVDSDLLPGAVLVVAEWEDKRRVATCSGSLPEGNQANAEHMASWHPVVAVAVADLLSNLADVEQRNQDEMGWSPIDISEALAIATAYLGSDA